MLPLVTVIIPNYNHARFLEKRINSVLDQTFQDFEVIILDDASTDNSREMIEGYRAHPKVVHIEYNAVNSGSPFKQWNKGVRLAHGEYIWIAESDDYADSCFLEKLVPLLIAAPKVGLVNCQSWHVNEHDNVFGLYDLYDGRSPCYERWTHDYRNSGNDECATYLVRECFIRNVSAVLMRRNVYLTAGLADEMLRQSGDWLLYVKLLLRSDIVFVAQPLNYLRRHPQAQTIRLQRSVIRFWEDLYVFDYIRQHVRVRQPVQSECLKGFAKELCRLETQGEMRESHVTISRRTLRLLRNARSCLVEHDGDRCYDNAQKIDAQACYRAACAQNRMNWSAFCKLKLLHLGYTGRLIRNIIHQNKKRYKWYGYRLRHAVFHTLRQPPYLSLNSSKDSSKE